MHDDYFALKNVPTGQKASILPKVEIERCLKGVRTQIDNLVNDLKKKLAEQERLRQLQEQLEAERKLRAEEEQRQKEAEEIRRRKAELEERARLELEREQAAAKAAAAAAAAEAANKATQQQAQASASANSESNGSYDSLTLNIDQEERIRQAEALKRIEQEKRDFELARRLSQDTPYKNERSTGNTLLNDDAAAAVQAAGYGIPVLVCILSRCYKTSLPI